MLIVVSVIPLKNRLSVKTTPQQLSVTVTAVLVLRCRLIFVLVCSEARHRAPVPAELNLRLSVAWSNALPSLAQRVRKCNHKIGKGIMDRVVCQHLRACNMYRTPLRMYNFIRICYDIVQVHIAERRRLFCVIVVSLFLCPGSSQGY